MILEQENLSFIITCAFKFQMRTVCSIVVFHWLKNIFSSGLQPGVWIIDPWGVSMMLSKGVHEK